MGTVQVRSLDQPDETRSFPNGAVEMVHEGYCVSGSAIVRAEDGTETRVGPGDGYVVQPGHDAWVVGDEPWVTVDFSQAMADCAKPGGAV
jgi:uncharacterized cupin superfamily protein